MSKFINRKQFIAATQSLHCEPCRHQKDCLNCDIGHMIRKVKNFPSADVAPVVHGHWITVYREDGKKADKCSVCTGAVKYFDYKYGVCPNCGAKMDESEASGND